MPSEPDYIREFFELFERPRILPFIMGFAGIDPCEKHQGGGGGDFPEAPIDGKIYGRKDAAWTEVQAGGASTHNALDGLQGGKAGGGGEYYHLTEAEYRRLPIRPTVISPVNGATGVNQVPQIVGSPYSSPWDVPMRARHCQIAADAGFGNIVWEEESFSASVVWQVLLKPDQTPYVSPNTRYYVRIRYQDKHGRWSEWSGASAFTTMAVFPESVILTPVMLMPTEGGELPPVNPFLAMTSPKVLAGAENFDVADWQVSNDQSFESTLYSASESEGVTVHRTEGVNLATALGVQFYARGRQRTSGGEWSPWAVPVSFTVRPDYEEPVFGMRRVFSKKYGRASIWQIDPEGRQVHIPHSYFDRHPLYAFPVSDLPIGETGLASNMAFVAPCWVKLDVQDNDDGDMVMDLWFSATPQTGDGWFLHPAFADRPDGFWHGTCIARTATVGGKGYWYSEVGAAASGKGGALGRYLNEGVMPRWRVWDIYERRLLLDLMMAEYGTFAAGDISQGFDTSNTDMSFRWRAFYGLLWGGTSSAMVVYGGNVGAYENGVLRSMTLVCPQGSNVIELAMDLTESGYLAEIHRGVRPELGFDVAMLGIPQALSAAETHAFGTDAVGRPVLGDRQGSVLNMNASGLFAFAPATFQTNYNYTQTRISRDVI